MVCRSFSTERRGDLRACGNDRTGAERRDFRRAREAAKARAPFQSKRLMRSPNLSKDDVDDVPAGAQENTKARSDADGRDRGFVVGYRRPPLHSRFKPGISGNPRGRPKGSKNLDSLCHSLLSRKVTIHEAGARRKVTAVEAILLATITVIMYRRPCCRATWRTPAPFRASARRRSRSSSAILAGKIASFEEIAAAENLNEAYVRRLAVLAFLSPKIVRAVAGGVAPAGRTASGSGNGRARLMDWRTRLSDSRTGLRLTPAENFDKRKLACRDAPPERAQTPAYFGDQSSGRKWSAIKGSETSGEFFGDKNDVKSITYRGWGGRIRTSVWRNQNPLPYHLATPHRAARRRAVAAAIP